MLFFHHHEIFLYSFEGRKTFLNDISKAIRFFNHRRVTLLPESHVTPSLSRRSWSRESHCHWHRERDLPQHLLFSTPLWHKMIRTVGIRMEFLASVNGEDEERECKRVIGDFGCEYE
ncbi:hypothetical protein VNO78_08153 [Psophocarpus tetragonolobus]|uniref:Uncharacterized protein n=1 Tax=Psophocarpus tetragonolobus TaxID=3891 RepID=A0AAN9SUL9_PSOTE